MRSVSSRHRALFIAIGLAALVACTTANPAPPPSGTMPASPPPAAPERRRGDPVAEFAAMLGGRWEGVTPGNNLRLNIETVAFHSLAHPYDMFLEISGQFDGTNVRQQGFLHLESQGRGVYVGYIPHFDPAVGALSPGVGRFSASEANAACSLYIQPRGDGFFGDNQGPTCAFAIHGAIGRWSLEVQPGMLVVRSETSGETLRFRRLGS